MVKKKPKSRFFIGNIVWNKFQWHQVYIESRSGMSYGKDKPVHECRNFDFNKKGIDDDKHVFGYVPYTTGWPRQLVPEDVVMFLYTKNLDTRNCEIVGIYGGYENVEPEKRIPDSRFHEGKALFNVKAEKKNSILFPIPLDDKKYCRMMNTNRLVPQANLKYIDKKLAETIITDEINALRESGTELGQHQKLFHIYEYITGRKYKVTDSDEDEQEKLENLPEIKTQSDQEIIDELQSLGPQTSVLVTYSGKSYKRDNVTIARIKKLRKYKCQLCGHYILRKDGSKYVEAAHITDKSKKGVERLHNIITMCPNHHKEFDKGDRKIIKHTNDKIIFELNGKRYQVDFLGSS